MGAGREEKGHPIQSSSLHFKSKVRKKMVDRKNTGLSLQAEEVASRPVCLERNSDAGQPRDTSPLACPSLLLEIHRMSLSFLWLSAVSSSFLLPLISLISTLPTFVYK